MSTRQRDNKVASLTVQAGVLDELLLRLRVLVDGADRAFGDIAELLPRDGLVAIVRINRDIDRGRTLLAMVQEHLAQVDALTDAIFFAERSKEERGGLGKAAGTATSA